MNPNTPVPDDVVEELTKHLRQYKHNDGSGFVFGYDKEGIDSLFVQLQRQRERTGEGVPKEAIESILAEVMEIAVSNGANSISMPDQYVEVAAWLAGIPTPSHSDVITQAVDRFLGWKLPDNFSPDNGISFQRYGDYEHPVMGRHKFEPIGTNLLDADQAKAMFEYCLRDLNLTISSRELLEKIAELKKWPVKGDNAVHNAAIDKCIEVVRALMPKEETPDNELPGMWERADFEGGKEEVRRPDWTPLTAEQAAADMKRRCIEVCKSLITSKGPRDEWTRTQDQAFQIAVDELESLPTSDTAMEEMRRDAERLDWVLEKGAFVLHETKSQRGFTPTGRWQAAFCDENENLHVPAGEDKYFDSEREAIDAAIAAENSQTEPKVTGSEN